MNDYEKMYADAVLNDYSPKITPRAVALRKLDRKAKLPAAIFTYTFGMAAALVLGAGMCLTMGVIGGGTVFAQTAGIIMGLAGIGMASVNYPLYRRMLENGKARYAEDILALAREIKEGSF